MRGYVQFKNIHTHPRKRRNFPCTHIDTVDSSVPFAYAVCIAKNLETEHNTPRGVKPTITGHDQINKTNLQPTTHETDLARVSDGSRQRQEVAIHGANDALESVSLVTVQGVHLLMKQIPGYGRKIASQ